MGIAGDAAGPGIARDLYIRLLGFVYLFAFVSMAVQVTGLVGEDGILPANVLLERAKWRLGLERFHLLPTLFWLGSEDLFLKAVCWGGAALSILLVLGRVSTVVYFVLWFFYLSLSVVGGDFMSFQWDALLLEQGLLAFFLTAPRWLPQKIEARPPSRIAVWLHQWLLFRLMFSSGVVKLASGDPAWRSLTALQYHYETQPLPHVLSWHAHHWPAVVHTLEALGMFVVELVLPFFIFFGPRFCRLLSFLGFVGLQAAIMLTGNYCFFNLQVLALCLFLLWGQSQNGTVPFWDCPKMGLSHRCWPRWVLVPFLVITVFLTSIPLISRLYPGMVWPTPVKAVYGWFLPFRSFNAYGLFAVMTKDRPEIIVEGSDDAIDWKPYAFKYKPGDPGKAPRWNMPHQPRLDWQMWFAALDDYRAHPWFMLFCQRLLEGSRDVLALLEENPFPERPPRYIRADVYQYKFTTPQEREETGHWWKRERRGPYCPTLSLEQGL